MTRYLWPLGIFILLVVLLAAGLKLDPKKVPSPFIGKPAPEFSLPTLYREDMLIGNEQMKGRVWLLNVWASWCVSCRAEHKVITRLANMKLLPVVGLNYKDKRDDAKRWLAQFGNPYTVSAWDNKGKVGIDWGVYGVPESFVIDQSGVVRYKHIGPVTDESLQTILIPLINQLQSTSS